MISPNTNVFVSSYKVIEFTDGDLSKNFTVEPKIGSYVH